MYTFLILYDVYMDKLMKDIPPPFSLSSPPPMLASMGRQTEKQCCRVQRGSIHLYTRWSDLVISFSLFIYLREIFTPTGVKQRVI